MTKALVGYVKSLKISKQHFGKSPEGTEVSLYTLTAEGIEVQITNYGGAIVSIQVPDRNGKFGDVVLGYSTLAEYMKNPRYLGALLGRFANRISLGKFSLNGVRYQLETNNGPNHLHGGPKGFDKVFWQGRETIENDSAVLHLRYLSRDGEEAYPGNLEATVTYTLTPDRELRLDYTAVTDRTTIVNLTNHSYFNLTGTGTILDHTLQLNADAFTPIGADLIPTGEIRNVSGTPMDFREPVAIGKRVDEPDEQLGYAGGYDHNFVLNNQSGSLRRAAKVSESGTGRTLEVFTTQPGMQFYSGNFLDGSLTGKRGVVFVKRSGFCVEPQHFPDSPNHPNFPTTVLEPGEEYKQTTVFRFGTES